MNTGHANPNHLGGHFSWTPSWHISWELSWGVLEGPRTRENQPSWALSWVLSWFKFRFRLLCALPTNGAQESLLQGRILHTPTPHPYKYPSRGGGRIKGGGYKNPATWGLKIHPPPPSPEKCLLARNGGKWGGAHIISSRINMMKRGIMSTQKEDRISCRHAFKSTQKPDTNSDNSDMPNASQVGLAVMEIKI